MESFWAPSEFNRGGTTPHRNQIKFEEARVQAVLRVFGLTGHEQAMRERFREAWGKDKRLTFESFYEFFPTFPVMLCAQSFYRTTKKNPLMQLPSLLENFQGIFIWDRYCDLLRQYRDICERRGVLPGDPLPPSLHGLPLGMVFNYDGMQGGLILHNGTPLTNGLCLRFDGKLKDVNPGQSEQIRCWIEPFSQWLDALSSRGWSPESPSTPLAVEPPLPAMITSKERFIPLRPWAVRALGAGPASFLLSWLYHAVRANPATNPRAAAFQHMRKGRKCIAASHADICHVLRLTDKQVRSAVHKLRKDGFLTATRGLTKYGVKTMFELNEDRCAEAWLDDRETTFNEDCPAELEPFRWEDMAPLPGPMPGVLDSHR